MNNSRTRPEYPNNKQLGIRAHNWLISGTKDLATAEVLRTWGAWGDCAPYPSEVKLTPITK